MKIILGSSSPRREEILRRIIDNFEIIIPEVDEDIMENEAPPQYSKRISIKKAESIFNLLSTKETQIVICCDTIVTIDNTIIGKPLDHANAIQIIKMLSGKAHNVISSITLIYKDKCKNKVIHTDSEITLVIFKKLSDEDISTYLQRINYMDKAGAYAIQEFGELLIERIYGSISNVIGFPLRLFFKMISELHIWSKLF